MTLYGSRGEHVVEIPVGPMGPVGIPWEWELGAKLLGIEMGMGIKSSRVGENGNFVFREIPTPSDLYQIYSNLQIEFTMTVALVVYFFISFWYHFVCLGPNLNVLVTRSSVTK